MYIHKWGYNFNYFNWILMHTLTCYFSLSNLIWFISFFGCLKWRLGGQLGRTKTRRYSSSRCVTRNDKMTRSSHLLLLCIQATLVSACLLAWVRFVVGFGVLASFICNGESWKTRTWCLNKICLEFHIFVNWFGKSLWVLYMIVE